MELKFEAEYVVLPKCPGCGARHRLNLIATRGGPRWIYNGNPEKPTFRPSVRVVTEVHGAFGSREVCHFLVTEGTIEFMKESTHHLAGKRVPLA